MKANHVVAWISCSLLIIKSFAGLGQCSGTVRQVSYDTTVTSNGSLLGPHKFTFRQFNDTASTLLSIRLSSVVTASYEYTVENITSNARNAKVMASRYDEISGATLSTALDATGFSPQNTHLLAATDGVQGSGADFHVQPPGSIYNGDTIISQSYSNTADYTGAGTVEFDYFYDLDAVSTTPVVLDLRSQITEQTTFVITYTYCDNVILAGGFMSFTAERAAEGVQLRWSVDNEKKGGYYIVEKSNDGRNFSPVAQLPSRPGAGRKAMYDQLCKLGSADQNTVFFRIFQHDADGTFAYSVIRSIEVSPVQATTLRIQPNPAKSSSVSISISNTEPGEWQLDVYSMTGQLITRKRQSNTSRVQVALPAQTKRGIYVLRAMNLRTRQLVSDRIVIE